MYIATVHYPLCCATMDFPSSHSVHVGCTIKITFTLAGCNQTIFGISPLLSSCIVILLSVFMMTALWQVDLSLKDSLFPRLFFTHRGVVWEWDWSTRDTLRCIIHHCHLGCFVSSQLPYSYECIGTHLRESIMYCRCQVVADKACRCGMANVFIATTLTACFWLWYPVYG